MKRALLSPLALVSLAFLGLGCEEETYPFEVGPTMLPGDNCRSCHGANTSAYPEAPDFSVAGTVYEGLDDPRGAHDVTVRIRDDAGKLVELETNHVGNFYTTERFTLPYSVELERDGVKVVMPMPPPAGGCNACHATETVGGAPGRLYLPASGSYQSALECNGESTVTATLTGTRYECAPYRCVSSPAVYCLTGCALDADCAGAARCVEGRCR